MNGPENTDITDTNPTNTDTDTSEAHDRVTGRARFAQDIPADALHMAVLRSPYPHADIVGIDTTKALAVPGVRAVLHAGDIGEKRFGRFTRDYPVFAVDKVVFAGQPVAAVAADDLETAKRAAGLISVEYAERAPLLSPEESLSGAAEAIHPDYADYLNAVPVRSHHNVQGEDARVTGDPEAAFAECDEVFENTFTWQRSSSAPMETHGALVDASGDRVIVHASHKEPYKLRRDLAALSGRPEEDFEIRPVKIGGDFGSKGNPFVESMCYFLSARTGRPVRGRLSFAETLGATGGRHAGSLTLRTGLAKGRIHAHQSRFVLDGGAFVAPKPMPKGILPMLGLPLGAYDVGHLDESAVGAYTNTLPGSHVRSPGEFQTIFASESHLEMIARERGEDPLEFKSRHARHGISRKLIEKVRCESALWKRGGEVDGHTVIGTGYSLFHRSAGPGDSTVRLTANGQRVVLELAVPDQGAGSFETFGKLVATRLGLERSQVQVKGRGTDSGLVDLGAGASRVTVVVGRACDDAAAKLLEGLQVSTPPQAATDAAYWIADALQALGTAEISVEGRGSVGRDEVEGLGHAHGALAVQVAVEPDTGIIRARRAVLAVNVGPVLNPVGLRGQLEGGFVYGLSQTLFEDLRPQEGRIELDSFNDYKIASGVDIPELALYFVDESELPAQGLAGVRAVGELVNIGVPAALANAIDDAVGVRLTALPLSAERVLDGIRKKASLAVASR
ncbi:xanthine dehydrogenase family protein molybdopterin-binding subunit [Paenarthrobacter ureafaciens]|uniref:xanthine dehydrogenase family protein molybdopterin-binding subunit n=1 Tax=Paenarthrobacter ureafaciens TaxID=37931 RepID=UPI001FB3AE3E|nr:xanthine dehydrogenase family protein molybdopterin-binding subunit [Paenarthrobacter ureafaciens]UOD81769.1 xanthine dehydrogenase family protein molybdopterin-binding subunit [Paenarthrobacter ureafaciens]WNZ05260.1 xanthine dehydrogenase family protein molybdopterin-binding subunit [Paenarthrobacter ureafaciens]